MTRARVDRWPAWLGLRRTAPARWFAGLGPGFVTAAASDDPSSIGTYAVAGAGYGLATLWTAVLTLPMLAVTQAVAARVAIVSGDGLSRVLLDRYRAPIPQLAVFAVTVANVLVIAADIGFLAELGHTFLPLPIALTAVLTAVGVLALQLFGNYRFVSGSLRLLALSLFSYVITAVVVHPDPGTLLRATFIPTIRFDRAFVFVLIAISGATIAPYLMWWQAAAEVEEERLLGRVTRILRRGASNAELSRSRRDIVIGAVGSNLVMWGVIVTASQTFYATGAGGIMTAADAANALRPLAGDFAALLFAAGLVGAGRLAIPVLTSSTAYAVAELFGWPHGLGEPIVRARRFYAVIVVATVLAVAITVVGIPALVVLLVASVLNAVVAPAVLALTLVVAGDERIMVGQPIGRRLAVAGWAVVVLMAAAVAALAVL